MGIINPNWQFDSCLPSPEVPCTQEGVPIYVINASCSEHVAAGVDFARTHSVRLNVKGSGHDYLGRSTAGNSLSIWTKHIRGIEFHTSFQPRNCHDCESFPAATIGAGQDWGELYAAAHKHGRTFVGGTGDTIGLGGYLTGGGHSPLSAMLGLAVDQILQMEVVMPCGQTVIANQVLNADLFWAMRGVSLSSTEINHQLNSFHSGWRSNVWYHDFSHPQDLSRNASRICICADRCSTRL